MPRRGPAGIGKTRLLAEARGGPPQRGMRVPAGARRRAGARVPVRRRAPAIRAVLVGAALDERDELAGLGRLGDPVVAGRRARRRARADASFARLPRALLADREPLGGGPLALFVDDLHWCDPPSLAALEYIGRRLEGLPVLVVLASRPHGARLRRGDARQLAGEPRRSWRAGRADPRRRRRAAAAPSPRPRTPSATACHAHRRQPAAGRRAREARSRPRASSGARRRGRSRQRDRRPRRSAAPCACGSRDCPRGASRSRVPRASSGDGSAASRTPPRLAASDATRPRRRPRARSSRSSSCPAGTGRVRASGRPRRRLRRPRPVRAARGARAGGRMDRRGGRPTEEVAAHVLECPPAGDESAVRRPPRGGGALDRRRQRRPRGRVPGARALSRAAPEQRAGLLFELGTAEQLVNGPRGRAPARGARAHGGCCDAGGGSRSASAGRSTSRATCSTRRTCSSRRSPSRALDAVDAEPRDGPGRDRPLEPPLVALARERLSHFDPDAPAGQRRA